MLRPKYKFHKFIRWGLHSNTNNSIIFSIWFFQETFGNLQPQANLILIGREQTYWSSWIQWQTQIHNIEVRTPYILQEDYYIEEFWCVECKTWWEGRILGFFLFTHITYYCPYWEAMKEMNLFGNGRIAKGEKKGNSLLQSYLEINQ